MQAEWSSSITLYMVVRARWLASTWLATRSVSRSVTMKAVDDAEHDDDPGRGRDQQLDQGHAALVFEV